MTVPEYSDSTSMMTSSNGSSFSPVDSHVEVMIFGGDTVISYPSRLICSIKIPSCNSPLACTTDRSESVSDLVTLSVTLLSVSLINRSRTRELATMVPSFPANGEVLPPISMDKVGGLMGGVCNALLTGFDFSVRVSPTAMLSGTPARVTISPAFAMGGSKGVRETPRLTNMAEIVLAESAASGMFCGSMSLGISATVSFLAMVPE
mmetsp:Transcript_38612/g.57937  ORF Transcript_38612/g.57937 Transcript_38612/m.57937 type:complete len:206 (+) Transcript_38612:720-1337(+)